MGLDLNIGGMEACTTSSPTIHACKHPCHQHAVGYRGSLPSEHPERLIAIRHNQLYLNMVDTDHLKHEYTGPILDAALEFIDRFRHQHEVINIHCNQGISRAPSIALLYMAKRGKTLPDDSFEEAAQAFLNRYSDYSPGRGVAGYLRRYWGQIR